MDPAEFNAYRERSRRSRTILWWTTLLAAAGSGLAVGYLWSFAAGIPLAAVLALLGLEVFVRVDKALSIKRFPELADPAVRWTRRYHL